MPTWWKEWRAWVAAKRQHREQELVERITNYLLLMQRRENEDRAQSIALSVIEVVRCHDRKSPF